MCERIEASYSFVVGVYVVGVSLCNGILVEDFFLSCPALRFSILFYFSCFLLFLSFFFFLFTNATLFHSFYHLVRQCTVSVWYWPHSADRCLYTIVKPPKHVARTPLSANPPTILALPRSPALTFSHLLFFLLLFIIRVTATATSFASIISFPSSCLLFLQRGSLPPTVGIYDGSGLRDSFITPRDRLATPTQTAPTTRT